MASLSHPLPHVTILSSSYPTPAVSSCAPVCHKPVRRFGASESDGGWAVPPERSTVSFAEFAMGNAAGAAVIHPALDRDGEEEEEEGEGAGVSAAPASDLDGVSSFVHREVGEAVACP